jgi:hypothetical protein
LKIQYRSREIIQRKNVNNIRKSHKFFGLAGLGNSRIFAIPVKQRKTHLTVNQSARLSFPVQIVGLKELRTVNLFGFSLEDFWCRNVGLGRSQDNCLTFGVNFTIFRSVRMLRRFE